VLEAPTATLIGLTGDTLATVPAESTGILAGTTARWLLDHAGGLGFTADERLVTVDGLVASAGAWLTSSVRGLAAGRSIDGAPVPYSPELTTRMRDLLGVP
jgi:4-amino-4-deoxychorismate lyase